MGLTASTAEALFDAGVDVITSGNHIWDKREIYPFLDANERILRPLNYGTHDVPGRGWGVYHALDGTELAVINLQGRTYMQPIDNPFTDADRLLDEASEPLPPIRLVDFHCEITSEKNALGLYLDGRVSVVVGTHTHVVTGDERILPGGTAYQTDLGMTGPAVERHRVRPGDRPAAVHQRPADAVRGGRRAGGAQRLPGRHRPGDRPRRSRSSGSSGWSRSEPVSNRHARRVRARRRTCPAAGPRPSTSTPTPRRSDGVLEPAELVRQAADGRRPAVRHHRPRQPRRLPRAACAGRSRRRGLELVPGVEINAVTRGARARDPEWRAPRPRARRRPRTTRRSRPRWPPSARRAARGSWRRSGGSAMPGSAIDAQVEALDLTARRRARAAHRRAGADRRRPRDERRGRLRSDPRLRAARLRPAPGSRARGGDPRDPRRGRPRVARALPRGADPAGRCCASSAARA